MMIFKYNKKISYSYYHGHKIYSINLENYRYLDGIFIKDEIRPCKFCNKKINKEEADPCIGFINNPFVTSVCCGHNVNKPYLVFDKQRFDFESIKDLKNKKREIENK